MNSDTRSKFERDLDVFQMTEGEVSFTRERHNNIRGWRVSSAIMQGWVAKTGNVKSSLCNTQEEALHDLVSKCIRDKEEVVKKVSGQIERLSLMSEEKS